MPRPVELIQDTFSRLTTMCFLPSLDQAFEELAEYIGVRTAGQLSVEVEITAPWISRCEIFTPCLRGAILTIEELERGAHVRGQRGHERDRRSCSGWLNESCVRVQRMAGHEFHQAIERSSGFRMTRCSTRRAPAYTDVAEERIPDMRHVHANLMCSSRVG
jgi:hypothetical protein